MKFIEVICFLNVLSLIALIFIRNPLKMARIETNTNRALDNSIILLAIFFIIIVLGLKCW
uniref:Protein-export membrane protein SecG n=1 Tax=Eustigmatophyceae sp. Ndem 8/9T-3m6.8 TaxID=2506146 RepID=A0A410D2I0_9STRA|nr:protein-export membrane protein SecG [Eustigmatophyceae sp. Ndem 8/9T-3m6.8]QAA11919.1 protein-export membrane protein SecG [Eustigmatophyceae sp. Ndem 8/9T-3m6.8]